MTARAGSRQDTKPTERARTLTRISVQNVCMEWEWPERRGGSDASDPKKTRGKRRPARKRQKEERRAARCSGILCDCLHLIAHHKTAMSCHPCSSRFGPKYVTHARDTIKVPEGNFWSRASEKALRTPRLQHATGPPQAGKMHVQEGPSSQTCRRSKN